MGIKTVILAELQWHHSTCIVLVTFIALSAVLLSYVLGKWSNRNAVNVERQRLFCLREDFSAVAPAALAHDLRQPIAAAKLILRDVKSQVDDETILSVLQRLDGTVESIATTVEHAFLCGKSRTIALEQRYRVVNVADVLGRVFSEMEILAAQRNLDFRLRCVDQYIISDPAMLYRIIQNLISNALKCVTAGGVLLSMRRCREAGVLIQICDTGPGMSAHQVARLTEGAHLSSSERTGLGLDIVRNFCAALGIEISVKTSGGRGSTVSLFAPGMGTHTNKVMVDSSQSGCF